MPFFLIVMLSGIYTPIFGLLKFSKYRSYSSLASIEVTQVSQVVLVRPEEAEASVKK